MVKRVLCVFCCILICVFFVQRCLQYGNVSPPSSQGFFQYLADYSSDFFSDTVFASLKEFINGFELGIEQFNDLFLNNVSPYIKNIVMFVVNFFKPIVYFGYYSMLSVTFIVTSIKYVLDFIFYLFNYFL